MAESYKSVYSHWFALMRLIERTGCPIREVYGQRIYGPHPDHRGIIPPKGSEVFVGKLPRDIFEDDLVPLFSKAGTIYEMRLMMDGTGMNRGYAFVTYIDIATADLAVQLLDNFEITSGRTIGVCKSVDNCRLYVGGIPSGLSRGDIFAEFIMHTSGIKDVFVYPGPDEPYAYIVYQSHRAAAIARRELVTGKINLWNRNTELKIDWAPPESVVDPVVMQRYWKGNVDTELRKYLKEIKKNNGVNAVLCIRNVSEDLDEVALRNFFSLRGRLRISKVRKIRDSTFLHYETKFEAQLALSKTNGITFGNRVIEVTWANTPEYTIQKPVGFKINSHELYRRFVEDRNTESRDAALKEELNPHCFDTSAFLPSSLSPIDFPHRISASKSHDKDYTDLLASYCRMKDWSIANYECSTFPRAFFAMDRYKCKLSVPGVKVFGVPLTVVVRASTSFKAKNMAAYAFMAKAGLIDTADGMLNGFDENEFYVSSDIAINELGENLINGISRLSLNDVNNGKGDHGQFQSTSADVFTPCHSPSSSHGAIPKRRDAFGHGASTKYGQSSADSTARENNSAHSGGAANLFYSDYSDDSFILNDIMAMGKKTSGEDTSGPRRDF